MEMAPCPGWTLARPSFLSVYESASHHLLSTNPTNVGILIFYGIAAVRSQSGWEAPVLQMA